jgi:hypothetical protein
MFVRFLCNHRPYRDGQCLEIPDRIGAHFVDRAMAEVVSAADVREYDRTMAAVDREIDKRINGTPTPRSAAAPVDPVGHPVRAAAGKRVITEDQWRHESGQDQPGYWAAARRYDAAAEANADAQGNIVLNSS